ncbi:multidrug transporter, putative [Babesia ovis]|uniref:Multidrug transporter, putative n=1 Tax=Babesia ovis TaxID=5869 RepID=A0A9W5WVS0_BABOV|nr:multidrug transporter, putative [Babesia ovis]
MKIALSCMFLAVSQFKLIFSERVDTLEDNDVFPTVEKRFKAVMKMMNATGFDDKFLNFVKEKGNNHCEAVMSKTTEISQLVASAHHDHRTQVTGENGTECQRYNDAFIENLKKLGAALRSIFTALYGADYKNVALGTGTKSLKDNAEAQDGTEYLSDLEARFLDLRFVVPLLNEDIETLFELINPGKKTTVEKTGIKDQEVEMVGQWIENNTPGIPKTTSINAELLWKALTVLFGQERNVLPSLKARVEVYNNNSDDTKEARERCKKQNSALLGSVAALVACVVTFTVL